MTQATLRLRNLVRALTCGSLVSFASGCPGGGSGPGVLSTSGFTDGSAGDDADGDDDGTTGDLGDDGADDTTGEPANDVCVYSESDYGSHPTAVVDGEVLILADVCDVPALVAHEDDDNLLEINDDPQDPTPDENFRVVVYRPDDDGWPDEPAHPVVFFVPGANQSLYEYDPEAEDGPADEINVPPADIADHWYREIIDSLVARGIVVVAGQPFDQLISSGKRTSMLACMMLWAKDAQNGWVEADDDRITAGALLSGHSRGAGASLLLANSFPGLQAQILEMGDYELCGTVGIAPKWAPDSAVDPTPTNVTITDPDRAMPYFAIQGAIDEDTVGQGISAYDSVVPEDLAVVGDPESLDPYDRWLVWLYSVRHNHFGGVLPESPTPNGELIAKGAASYYLGAFVGSVLFGSASARETLMVPMDPASTASDFPSSDPDLVSSSLWSNVTPQYADAGGRPLVYGSYQQGNPPDDDARRFVIDTLCRNGVSTMTCNTSLGTSTAGTAVTYSTPGATTCFGPAEDLTDTATMDWDRHQGHALRVDWGDGSRGGYVQWSLRDDDGVPVVDLGDYTHLSMRIGNLVEIANPALSCLTLTDPDAFELRVELITDGGVTPAVLPSGVSVEQQTSTSLSVGSCSASQYMRTVRWELSSFCEEGSVALDQATAIRVYFDDDNDGHRALVDSIELTRDPSDPADSACSAASADFQCVATQTLVATETSCDGMPVSGRCDGQDIETNPVSLPTWIVHTPKGWVADPENPTQAEVDDKINAACIEACQLEFSDDPFVSANCTASGAFTTPTLVDVPGLGPERRIPPSAVNGSGLFSGQSLSCSLVDSCSNAFDENLAAARPQRTTAAGWPIMRGEETRLSLGGTETKATFITPSGSVSMPLIGEVGYTICPEGATGTTCPFYLGSLSLSGTSPVTVNATCPDSSAFSMQVTDLDIELLQPAFGIADENSLEKAFPTGALHMLGQVMVEGQGYAIRAVNEEPVFVSADYVPPPTLVPEPIAFAGDLDIDLDVPCGDDILPVTLRLDVEAETSLDAPPFVLVMIPDYVSCPATSLSLNAYAWDPDDDLESVRWYVDDVLIAPGTTSLPFNGAPRVFRAVARDERGATWTHEKTVSCIPE